MRLLNFVLELAFEAHDELVPGMDHAERTAGCPTLQGQEKRFYPAQERFAAQPFPNASLELDPRALRRLQVDDFLAGGFGAEESGDRHFQGISQFIKRADRWRGPASLDHTQGIRGEPAQ